MTPQERRKAKEEKQAQFDRNRCWFIYENNKRCSMSRTEHHDALCAFHAQCEEEANANAHFGQSIVNPAEPLDNARAVAAVLTRVLHLAATSQITPKHAATLAYLLQLQLMALTQIRKEEEFTARRDAQAAQKAAEMEDPNAPSPLEEDMFNAILRKIDAMPDPVDPYASRPLRLPNQPNTAPPSAAPPPDP